MIFNDSLDAVNDDDIPFISNTVNSVNRNRADPQTREVTESSEKLQKENQSLTIPKFQCKICKESLSSFYKLHTHLKNVHKATLEFTCNLCGKLFSKHGDLINHLEAHQEPDKINFIRKTCGSNSTAKRAQQNNVKTNNPVKSHSHSSKSKTITKRKKSVSNSKSKPKSKRAKRTRKNKNKTEKQLKNTGTQKPSSFTKGKRKRRATLTKQTNKSKIKETTEISSSSSVHLGKANGVSIEKPSAEISIGNPISPPLPSPRPSSSPQNPTVEDDWGWDTDPQLSQPAIIAQPELSTTLELELKPPPDSSLVSVTVLASSPKTPPPADPQENSVFEDYFEPLSPKVEVVDDWGGEDHVFNSTPDDHSPIPSSVSENSSSFPFQCSKCNLQFRRNDLLAIHQSFHNLLVLVNFPGPKHEDDINADYLDGELYPKFVEENGTDQEPFVTVQIPTPVEPPRKEFPPHPVDGVSEIMSYNCVNCNTTFCNQNELNIHTKSCCEANIVSCPKCALKFETKCALEQHFKEDHWKSEERMVDRNACPHCKKVFEGKSYLSIHLRRHNQEKPFTCPVSDCSSTFVTANELTRHRKSKHPQPHDVQHHACPTCEKVFTNRRSYAMHIQRHSTEKRFPCPEADCSKAFTTKDDLRKHIKRNHSGQGDGNEISLPLSRKQLELNSIHNQNQSVCFICESNFGTQTELDKHNKAMHPREVSVVKMGGKVRLRLPCSCPETHCSAVLTNVQQLRRHGLSHARVDREIGDDVDVHLNLNAGGTPTFECKRCDKSYSLKLNLLTHLRKVHQLYRGISFVCELCGASFATRPAWARHKLRHEDNRDILCSDCGRLFPTQKSLQAHKTQRHSSKNSKEGPRDSGHYKSRTSGDNACVCEICGKTLATTMGLKTHMERHNSVPLICDQCGKPCKTEADLRVHKNTHLPEKPFKCNFCPYRYNQPTSFYSHMISHHTGTGVSGFVESTLTAHLERNFPCDVDGCSQRFTSLPCLIQHQLYHTGDKLCHCNKCPEKFVTPTDVYIHKLRVHRRRYECEHCKRNFTFKVTLDNHVRYKHTLEEPFTCPEPDCERKFKTKGDVSYHMVVAHTGQYKFECEVCGKKMVSKGNYNVHMRIHTGIRVFRCEEGGCEASFNVASLLKKHLHKEHGRTEVATE